MLSINKIDIVRDSLREVPKELILGNRSTVVPLTSNYLIALIGRIS